jgi:limonene 1,2-monooxygenase
MLCVAATDARGGFNVLDVNWKHACDAAAEHGNSMDRNNLRLMGPMHIAETRETARENVRFGLERYIEYARALTPGRFGDMDGKDPVDVLLQSGHIVIGTPDDAITVLSKLQDKQGAFGCFLHQAHDWADWDATKKSYELYMRFVAPYFSRANRNRDASYDDLTANSAALSEKSNTAAQKTFEKYAKEDEAAAALAAAQKSGMIGSRQKS